MTFYEAALRVLESEGRPLHVLEITEKSIQQSLLSHIGKVPEQTMLSRLAAMARRSRDRKVMVTAKDTFALVDWALPEDAAALEVTGVPEENPEEALPPLRPTERHPESRGDNVRAVGRTDRKRGRREEEEERGGRKRRFPPLPEVVFEILSEADEALTGAELLERARSRELASEELAAEQLLTALLEDNQRRIDAGRRPQFVFSRDTGRIQLERAGAPSEAPPLALQAAFAEALGIPLEGGRPVLRSLSQPSTGDVLADEALQQAAKAAVKDARRGMARALRRKLAELEPGTFEKACVKVLHASGFRELKVAKRGKEGPLLTARKREGSVELRYAIRMAKGSAPVDRRTVQELRRDLGHYSAQVGLLLSAGEVRADARGEAQASGALVMVWAGEALGDKFLEAQVGVNVTRLELYELDERFFEAARIDADESARKREERHRQRDQGEPSAPGESRREARRPAPRAETDEETPATEARADRSEAEAPPRERQGEEGDDGEAGDDDLEAASAFVSGQGGEAAEPGQPGDAPAGDRKRRRRRRRGRRGRGKDGAPTPGEPGAEGAPLEGGTPAEAGGAPDPDAGTPLEATTATQPSPADAAATPEAPPAVEVAAGEPSGAAPRTEPAPEDPDRAAATEASAPKSGGSPEGT